MPTDSPHAIVNGEAICTAPEGSPCRLDCPADTCDGWPLGAVAACEHGPLIDGGRCLAAEWVNADGLEDTYAGCGGLPEEWEGPINIRWHEPGGYVWEQINQTAEVSRDHP